MEWFECIWILIIIGLVINYINMIRIANAIKHKILRKK